METTRSLSLILFKGTEIARASGEPRERGRNPEKEKYSRLYALIGKEHDESKTT